MKNVISRLLVGFALLFPESLYYTYLGQIPPQPKPELPSAENDCAGPVLGLCR